MNGSVTISSLTFNNTNAYHTTQIVPGTTLAVVSAKGMTVGSESDQGSNAVVTATITGAGGTLVISNSAASLLVRQYITTASANIHRAILDLSGLDTFNLTATGIQLALSG